MKRFITLTVNRDPTSFGTAGSSARVLVDADLIQIIQESETGTLIVLGQGLGEIEVRESFDKLRRILCEEKKSTRDLSELTKGLSTRSARMPE